jgi:rfaE bifunctional protein nucleotidyltransferase chain/domain/rfaE bifunctional protein kinase chain/domain
MTVRLLVVGDTLLDRDVIGRVERVCPDAPVPVVDVVGVHERPGGAGLAALLAARDDVEVMLATGLGGGSAGARVRALLHGSVEVHDVRAGTPTVCKTRVRALGQSLLRLDDEGAVLGDAPVGEADGGTGADPRVDASLLRSLLDRCDAVLVSDYGGAVTGDTAVRSLLAEHAPTVPVVWDPHPRGSQPVAEVAISTPNRAEARHFVSLLDGIDLGDVDDPQAHAAALRRGWRVGSVCVTNGENGAVTVLHDDSVVRTSTVPCPDGTDTCGAGDRFAGSLAVALARGLGTENAVVMAQQDVGRWLLAGGVSTLRASDARASIPSHGPSARRSPARTASGPGPTSGREGLSADELVEQVRTRGGTVVATGGCFDVLHAGHLALLERARALGDCLVVLLNSDASVRRLKGPTRPVHGVADRARLLEGLACVDAVAVFEDDDPVATLARLRPDVWVKGGDYREEDLPEARTVRALGGRIALVPHLDGHSTTQILRHAELTSRSTVPDQEGSP